MSTPLPPPSADRSNQLSRQTTLSLSNAPDDMLVCVNCGTPISYLYKEFSAGNIRLAHCKVCRKVADKYLEYDTILLSIDAILHNISLYRHLLYNRVAHNKHRPNQPGIMKGWYIFLCVVLLMVYSKLYHWTLKESPNLFVIDMYSPITNKPGSKSPILRRGSDSCPLSEDLDEYHYSNRDLTSNTSWINSLFPKEVFSFPDVNETLASWQSLSLTENSFMYYMVRDAKFDAGSDCNEDGLVAYQISLLEQHSSYEQLRKRRAATRVENVQSILDRYRSIMNLKSAEEMKFHPFNFTIPTWLCVLSDKLAKSSNPSDSDDSNDCDLRNLNWPDATIAGSVYIDNMRNTPVAECGLCGGSGPDVVRNHVPFSSRYRLTFPGAIRFHPSIQTKPTMKQSNMISFFTNSSIFPQLSISLWDRASQDTDSSDFYASNCDWSKEVSEDQLLPAEPDSYWFLPSSSSQNKKPICMSAIVRGTEYLVLPLLAPGNKELMSNEITEVMLQMPGFLRAVIFMTLTSAIEFFFFIVGTIIGIRLFGVLDRSRCRLNDQGGAKYCLLKDVDLNRTNVDISSIINGESRNSTFRSVGIANIGLNRSSILSSRSTEDLLSIPESFPMVPVPAHLKPLASKLSSKYSEYTEVLLYFLIFLFYPDRYNPPDGLMRLQDKLPAWLRHLLPGKEIQISHCGGCACHESRIGRSSESAASHICAQPHCSGCRRELTTSMQSGSTFSRAFRRALSGDERVRSHTTASPINSWAGLLGRTRSVIDTTPPNAPEQRRAALAILLSSYPRIVLILSMIWGYTSGFINLVCVFCLTSNATAIAAMADCSYLDSTLVVVFGWSIMLLARLTLFSLRLNYSFDILS